MLRALPFLIAAAVFAAPAPTDWTRWQPVRGSATTDASVAREGRPSVRLAGDGASEAIVRSTPLNLTVGRTYELAGWVKTNGLRVRDLDRSPVAVGATLAMASMPFDVHSESIGGTHDWTRLSLRFTATRSTDAITLRVAEGGAFTGAAWFEGVSVDETSGPPSLPAKGAVKTFGPAYRYPKAGWIYLHIEGDPYQRGYQHGYLMPKEIEGYLDRCAAVMHRKTREEGWEYARMMANAVFLRGFDEEILAEMRGIADGAAAAGARYGGHKVDLIDIAAANVAVELGELDRALPLTSGLEALGFKLPDYPGPLLNRPTDRCSAFAATGPATRDGHMVVAHTTFWPLTLAEQTNVMLDIQPKSGHRVLMQSYPGGIESGTDWYQNDAGVVLTETTIGQTPYNRDGTPVAFRARKAIQYGGSIDDVARYLAERNNGLYTNEWLIGDGKTDEIAMFELGTSKTKLWRSGRNEWFGNTPGFYWGNNNAKDLDVRMEAIAGDETRDPAYSPAPRDVKWLELYDRYKGQIDEQFAYLAFRTAPLVSGAAMDAKVATAEMARNLMVWATIGKPNQREWVPRSWDKSYDKNDGMYDAGYTVFMGAPSQQLQAVVSDVERNRLAGATTPAPPPSASSHPLPSDKLWKGVVIPASDADAWLVAGAQRYSHSSGDGGKLRADYSFAAANTTEFALRDYRVDPRNRDAAVMVAAKGALLLNELRNRLGDEKFLALMSSFWRDHDRKPATTAEFRKAAGPVVDSVFDLWLDKPGLAGGMSTARYVAQLMNRMGPAIIVYGTGAEAGANRYAAEQLQQKFLGWEEREVPIRKDFEVADEDLRGRDVFLIGRPETNSVARRLAAAMKVDYTGAAFRIEGHDRASEYDGLAVTAVNPTDTKHIAVLLAGNTALQTVKTAAALPGEAEYAITVNGHESASGFRK